MTTLTLLSTLTLFGFIALCVNKHGLLPSYSAYAKYWNIATNVNLWQIFTFLAAFFLMPPIIERGAGSVWQFLGFGCCAYLTCVACTPDWETSKKEHTFHTIFAILCALCAFLWMALVCKVWYFILPVALFVAIVAYATKTLKSSLTFWAEMVMFLSTYITLLITI